MDTEQLRNQFLHDGYVIVENVLSPADLQPIIDDYSTLLDDLALEWYAAGVIPSLYADLPFTRRAAAIISHLDEFQYRHFDIALPNAAAITPETPIHLSQAVFDLLRHPRLLDYVELFIGPEIYSSPIQHARIKPPEQAARALSSKPSGLVTKTGWHQDMGVARPEADDTEMLTVWIAVTDATEENGCLSIIPGSHRQGLTTHCAVGGATIPEALLNGQPKALPMKAGSALFMHRLMKHASLANRSDAIRWSFDLRYQPTGQPTGRSEFPGMVVRSRAHPESVLADWQVWASQWLEARSILAQSEPIRSTHRWNNNDPACA